MPQTATVRRWQNRIVLPSTLAMLWLVLYTSAHVFDSAYVYPKRNVLEFLFSSQHLSQPLGWLFLLSLVVALVGLVVHGYILAAGH